MKFLCSSFFDTFSFGDILDDELPAKNTGPKEGDQV